MDKKALPGRAIRSTLPVMAGYLALGIGFGVLMHSKGYGVGLTALMSLVIYAGSMQYVAVDLLGAGAGLLSTALMTLMINARHFFYGLSMLDKYAGMGKARGYLIFALTDETYSLLCTAQSEPRAYYLLVSLLDHCYWVTGSVLGGLLGMALPFDTTGVDFAMTALFVVIFVEQWLSAPRHAPALLGLGLAAGCLLVFGPERFLIPAMIAITTALGLLRRKWEPSWARAARQEQAESTEVRHG